MDDQMLKLIEKLSEMHSNMAVMQNDIGHIKEGISEIKENVRINTLDLTEHKEGVITAKALLAEEVAQRKASEQRLEERVEKLEFMPKAAKWATGIIVSLLSGATAVYGLVKLFIHNQH